MNGSFAEMLYYDLSPEFENLLRELLALEMSCRRSVQFKRDDSGSAHFAIEPSPLHWSRQTEWPWAIHHSCLTGRESCLDIGGGWAIVKYALANRCHRLTALDTMDEALTVTQETAKHLGIQNITTVKGDARHLPFPDESFERVVCISVMEHIPNGHLLVAGEIKRVLKPGGIAIITMDLLVTGAVKDDFYVTQKEALEVMHFFGISGTTNPVKQGATLNGSTLTCLMLKYTKAG